MPVRKPALVHLPDSEAEQVAQLRDALMRRTQTALGALQPSLRRDASKAIDRIVESGYSAAVTRRETKRLVKGHYGRLRKEVAASINDVVGLVERYGQHMDKWEIEERRKASAAGPYIAPSRIVHGITQQAASEAALHGALADVPKRVFVAKTQADAFIARELRPWREKRKLSTRLHSSQVNASRDAVRLSMRAVREGKALQANNDLILGLARKGHAVGGAKRLPGYLQEFERAGNALMRMQKPSLRDRAATAAYNKAKHDWQTQRRAVRRAANRLAEGGRVQNALIEVLERTSKDNVKRLNSALDVFLNQKQSYNAERILDTEIHASYRSAQVARDRGKPWLIGYIWRLQRGARRDFARRTKPTKMKLPSGRRTRRARRCICEVMDGRRISKDTLASYPQGGHPHCMCWFEPVYDRRIMRRAPPTAAEERWYREEFG
jgi:hypothetical protein